MFAQLFGLHVVCRENRTTIIFHRWEAFNFNESISEPTGLASSLISGDLRDLIRGNIEICEIHKSFFTPVQNQKFDLNRFPDYGTLLRDNGRHVARPVSWVDTMSSEDHPSSRSSLSGPSRGWSHARGSNRSSPYPRPQSSSPSFRATYQRWQEASPETAKEQFIHRLRVQANILTTASLWLSPVEVTWNPPFLDEGIILFPDNRTQIRLWYWAICGTSMIQMHHILDFTGHQSEDEVYYHYPFQCSPPLPSAWEAKYVWAHEKNVWHWFSGEPIDLQWRRVSLHGSIPWKAGWYPVEAARKSGYCVRGAHKLDHYGGTCLVEEYMSRPLSQVTVHHRGGVAVAPSQDMPIFHDQLSKQEVELIHGYIPLGSPNKDRWAFPTSELLKEFSNHWWGEWNQGCKWIMGNIAHSLESGALTPLMRREWREYLRGNNRGEHTPAPGSVPKVLFFFSGEHDWQLLPNQAL